MWGGTMGAHLVLQPEPLLTISYIRRKSRDDTTTTHIMHTTDTKPIPVKKNGWGKHEGEYLRGSEYPCYQSSLLRGVPDSKYVLEKGHVRLWLPNSPRSCNRRANKHSRVCYQQCVLAHTLVWVWGRAQLFALGQLRAGTLISTTWCPLDTSLAALESP